MTTILLQPGINNSGPEHWQTYWEKTHRSVVRIEQSDWDEPVCEEWIARIEEAVDGLSEPPVIVAHSLGCLALAKWAAMSHLPVKALMFVSLPDATGPAFPPEAPGFEGLPLSIGGRKSLIVYSENDPFGNINLTRSAAAAWLSSLIGVGAKGHINASSGLKEWDFGWQLARSLCE